MVVPGRRDLLISANPTTMNVLNVRVAGIFLYIQKLVIFRGVPCFILRLSQLMGLGGYVVSNMEKIFTAEEYEQVLKRIDEIFQAEPDSPEEKELDTLIGLANSYEEEEFFPTIITCGDKPT